MSTRSVRFFGLLLMAAIAAAAGQSCGSEQPTQYDNFVAAAARADTEGWKPYWLGRSFTAGGLTFLGPGIGDFGEPIEGGGTG